MREHKSTNNAARMDTVTFGSCATRARWREVSDFMPDVHDTDLHLDDHMAMMPRPNPLMQLTSSCGLQPDQALMAKEMDSGPVGTLGPLRKPSIDAWLDMKLGVARKMWKCNQDNDKKSEKQAALRAMAKSLRPLNYSELVKLEGQFRYDKELVKAIALERKRKKAADMEAIEREAREHMANQQLAYDFKSFKSNVRTWDELTDEEKKEVNR